MTNPDIDSGASRAIHTNNEGKEEEEEKSHIIEECSCGNNYGWYNSYEGSRRKNQQSEIGASLALEASFVHLPCLSFLPQRAPLPAIYSADKIIKGEGEAEISTMESFRHLQALEQAVNHGDDPPSLCLTCLQRYVCKSQKVSLITTPICIDSYYFEIWQ